ncbi:unnamed protein product [Symbiodinium natans]|uniref:ShKT domain-containing protein n=1 Tax=Symbiodinium natans TaxID=878477 RepID=A0A812HC88_9DINO|nr:unnamed protein product [Symbiodinium natans]
MSAISAVKLEKALANLERKLRIEICDELEHRLSRELAPCLARLQALESHLETQFANEDRKSDDASEIIEVKLCSDKPHTLETIADPKVHDAHEAHEVHPQFHPQLEHVRAPDVDDTTQEPVAFMETTLNLILVLGYTGSGWIDILIACLLLLASMGMQITFCVILLTEDFLGNPFADNVAIAENWRRSVAHDYKYMDLEQTSLTSRVCNGDGKLILSTEHASLLGQINDFLDLQQDGFELSYFQPGTLLCMLCIFLWCLYICNELRSSLLSLEAVAQVPRSGRSKLQRGHLLCLSQSRFLVYCLFRCYRIGIAMGLLYAGVLWLGATTSITDLILNAVALSAVLQVDEIFYAALMPKQVQTSILDLEAIKVTYTHRRSQLESLLLFAFMAGLTLWSYFSVVKPLTESMMQVKQAYCGGRQDFVVASNTNQNITVGLQTRIFQRSEDAANAAQFAVEQWIQKPIGASPLYIAFARDNAHFDERLAQTMEGKALSEGECINWDTVFLGNLTHDRHEMFRPYFYSASLTLGLPADTNCSGMASFCDTFAGRVLRFVCPRTCGCHERDAQPLLRVASEGCPSGCANEAQAAMRSTPCQDDDVSEMQVKWDFFWDTYTAVMLYVFNIEDVNASGYAWLESAVQQVKKVGCPGIGGVDFPLDPFTGRTWCEGHADVYRPLAWLCPESCACAGADPLPEYCPQSCAGCKDADTFPVVGGISNCDQAKAAGLCVQFPDQALAYCAETCNLCHLIGNSTARRMGSVWAWENDAEFGEPALESIRRHHRRHQSP